MNTNILKFCCIISSMYSLPSKSVHIYGACIMYWDYSYSFSYHTPLQSPVLPPRVVNGWKIIGMFRPRLIPFLTLFCRLFHIDTYADADRWLYNELELHILSLFFRYVMKKGKPSLELIKHRATNINQRRSPKILNASLINVRKSSLLNPVPAKN